MALYTIIKNGDKYELINYADIGNNKPHPFKFAIYQSEENAQSVYFLEPETTIFPLSGIKISDWNRISSKLIGDYADIQNYYEQGSDSYILKSTVTDNQKSRISNVLSIYFMYGDLYDSKISSLKSEVGSCIDNVFDTPTNGKLISNSNDKLDNWYKSNIHTDRSIPATNLLRINSTHFINTNYDGLEMFYKGSGSVFSLIQYEGITIPDYDTLGGQRGKEIVNRSVKIINDAIDGKEFYIFTDKIRVVPGSPDVNNSVLTADGITRFIGYIVEKNDFDKNGGLERNNLSYKLTRDGFALTYANINAGDFTPYDDSMSKILEEAGQYARNNKLGIWGGKTYIPSLFVNDSSTYYKLRWYKTQDTYKNLYNGQKLVDEVLTGTKTAHVWHKNYVSNKYVNLKYKKKTDQQRVSIPVKDHMNTIADNRKLFDEMVQGRELMRIGTTWLGMNGSYIQSIRSVMNPDMSKVSTIRTIGSIIYNVGGVNSSAVVDVIFEDAYAINAQLRNIIAEFMVGHRLPIYSHDLTSLMQPINRYYQKYSEGYGFTFSSDKDTYPAEFREAYCTTPTFVVLDNVEMSTIEGKPNAISVRLYFTKTDMNNSDGLPPRYFVSMDGIKRYYKWLRDMKASKYGVNETLMEFANAMGLYSINNMLGEYGYQKSGGNTFTKLTYQNPKLNDSLRRLTNITSNSNVSGTSLSLANSFGYGEYGHTVLNIVTKYDLPATTSATSLGDMFEKMVGGVSAVSVLKSAVSVLSDELVGGTASATSNYVGTMVSNELGLSNTNPYFKKRKVYIGRTLAGYSDNESNRLNIISKLYGTNISYNGQDMGEDISQYNVNILTSNNETRPSALSLPELNLLVLDVNVDLLATKTARRFAFAFKESLLIRPLSFLEKPLFMPSSTSYIKQNEKILGLFNNYVTYKINHRPTSDYNTLYTNKKGDKLVTGLPYHYDRVFRGLGFKDSMSNQKTLASYRQNSFGFLKLNETTNLLFVPFFYMCTRGFNTALFKFNAPISMNSAEMNNRKNKIGITGITTLEIKRENEVLNNTTVPLAQLDLLYYLKQNNTFGMYLLGHKSFTYFNRQLKTKYDSFWTNNSSNFGFKESDALLDYISRIFLIANDNELRNSLNVNPGTYEAVLPIGQVPIRLKVYSNPWNLSYDKNKGGMRGTTSCRRAMVYDLRYARAIQYDKKEKCYYVLIALKDLIDPSGNVKSKRFAWVIKVKDIFSSAMGDSFVLKNQQQIFDNQSTLKDNINKINTQLINGIEQLPEAINIYENIQKGLVDNTTAEIAYVDPIIAPWEFLWSDCLDIRICTYNVGDANVKELSKYQTKHDDGIKTINVKQIYKDIGESTETLSDLENKVTGKYVSNRGKNPAPNRSGTFFDKNNEIKIKEPDPFKPLKGDLTYDILNSEPFIKMRNMIIEGQSSDILMGSAYNGYKLRLYNSDEKVFKLTYRYFDAQVPPFIGLISQRLSEALNLQNGTIPSEMKNSLADTLYSKLIGFYVENNYPTINRKATGTIPTVKNLEKDYNQPKVASLLKKMITSELADAMMAYATLTSNSKRASILRKMSGINDFNQIHEITQHSTARLDQKGKTVTNRNIRAITSSFKSRYNIFGKDLEKEVSIFFKARKEQVQETFMREEFDKIKVQYYSIVDGNDAGPPVELTLEEAIRRFYNDGFSDDPIVILNQNASSLFEEQILDKTYPDECVDKFYLLLRNRLVNSSLSETKRCRFVTNLASIVDGIKRVFDIVNTLLGRLAITTNDVNIPIEKDLRIDDQEGGAIITSYKLNFTGAKASPVTLSGNVDPFHQIMGGRDAVLEYNITVTSARKLYELTHSFVPTTVVNIWSGMLYKARTTRIKPKGTASTLDTDFDIRNENDVKNRNRIENLRRYFLQEQFFEETGITVSEQSIIFDRFEEPIHITHSPINAMGFETFIMDSMEVGTIPGTPGAFNLTLRLRYTDLSITTNESLTFLKKNILLEPAADLMAAVNQIVPAEDQYEYIMNNMSSAQRDYKKLIVKESVARTYSLPVTRSRLAGISLNYITSDLLILYCFATIKRMIHRIQYKMNSNKGQLALNFSDNNNSDLNKYMDSFNKDVEIAKRLAQNKEYKTGNLTVSAGTIFACDSAGFAADIISDKIARRARSAARARAAAGGTGAVSRVSKGISGAFKTIAAGLELVSFGLSVKQDVDANTNPGFATGELKSDKTFGFSIPTMILSMAPRYLDWLLAISTSNNKDKESEIKRIVHDAMQFISAATGTDGRFRLSGTNLSKIESTKTNNIIEEKKITGGGIVDTVTFISNTDASWAKKDTRISVFFGRYKGVLKIIEEIEKGVKDRSKDQAAQRQIPTYYINMIMTPMVIQALKSSSIKGLNGLMDSAMIANNYSERIAELINAILINMNMPEILYVTMNQIVAKSQEVSFIANLKDQYKKDYKATFGGDPTDTEVNEFYKDFQVQRINPVLLFKQRHDGINSKSELAHYWTLFSGLNQTYVKSNKAIAAIIGFLRELCDMAALPFTSTSNTSNSIGGTSGGATNAAFMDFIFFANGAKVPDNIDTTAFVSAIGNYGVWDSFKNKILSLEGIGTIVGLISAVVVSGVLAIFVAIIGLVVLVISIIKALFAKVEAYIAHISFMRLGLIAVMRAAASFDEGEIIGSYMALNKCIQYQHGGFYYTATQSVMDLLARYKKDDPNKMERCSPYPDIPLPVITIEGERHYLPPDFYIYDGDVKNLKLKDYLESEADVVTAYMTNGDDIDYDGSIPNTMEDYAKAYESRARIRNRRIQEVLLNQLNTWVSANSAIDLAYDLGKVRNEIYKGVSTNVTKLETYFNEASKRVQKYRTQLKESGSYTELRQFDKMLGELRSYVRYAKTSAAYRRGSRLQQGSLMWFEFVRSTMLSDHNAYGRLGRDILKSRISEAYENMDEDSVYATTIKSYPSVKLYFIEKDGDEWIMYDDVYSYSSIIEIAINRSRERATDVATIKVTNYTNKLTNVMAARYSVENPLTIDGDLEEGLNSIMLKPGCKIQVRMGYVGQMTADETVFGGEIVGITPIENGNILEITAQGFGAATTEQIANGGVLDMTGIIDRWYRKLDNYRSIIANIAYEMPKHNLGGITYLSEDFFELEADNIRVGTVIDEIIKKIRNITLQDAAERIFQDGSVAKALKYSDRIMENVRLSEDLTSTSDFANILLSAAGMYKGWVVYKQTGWDALSDVIMQIPNHCITVQPYDLRGTLVIGSIIDGYYKYTDNYGSQNYVNAHIIRTLQPIVNSPAHCIEFIGRTLTPPDSTDTYDILREKREYIALLFVEMLGRLGKMYGLGDQRAMGSDKTYNTLNSLATDILNKMRSNESLTARVNILDSLERLKKSNQDINTFLGGNRLKGFNDGILDKFNFRKGSALRKAFDRIQLFYAISSFETTFGHGSIADVINEVNKEFEDNEIARDAFNTSRSDEERDRYKAQLILKRLQQYYTGEALDDKDKEKYIPVFLRKGSFGTGEEYRNIIAAGQNKLSDSKKRQINAKRTGKKLEGISGVAAGVEDLFIKAFGLMGSLFGYKQIQFPSIEDPIDKVYKSIQGMSKAFEGPFAKMWEDFVPDEDMVFATAAQMVCKYMLSVAYARSRQHKRVSNVYTKASSVHIIDNSIELMEGFNRIHISYPKTAGVISTTRTFLGSFPVIGPILKKVGIAKDKAILQPDANTLYGNDPANNGNFYMSLNDSIYPHKLKTYSVYVRNGKSMNGFGCRALKVAGSNILAQLARSYYGGTLTIVGDPRIKPWDVVNLYDEIRDMHGTIQVREVTHIIGRDTGFKTVIVPDLPAYSELNIKNYTGMASIEAGVRVLNILLWVGAIIIGSKALKRGLISGFGKLATKGGALGRFGRTGASMLTLFGLTGSMRRLVSSTLGAPLRALGNSKFKLFQKLGSRAVAKNRVLKDMVDGFGNFIAIGNAHMDTVVALKGYLNKDSILNVFKNVSGVDSERLGQLIDTVGVDAFQKLFTNTAQKTYNKMRDAVEYATGRSRLEVDKWAGDSFKEAWSEFLQSNEGTRALLDRDLYKNLSRTLKNDILDRLDWTTFANASKYGRNGRIGLVGRFKEILKRGIRIKGTVNKRVKALRRLTKKDFGLSRRRINKLLGRAVGRKRFIGSTNKTLRKLLDGKNSWLGSILALYTGYSLLNISEAFDMDDENFQFVLDVGKTLISFGSKNAITEVDATPESVVLSGLFYKGQAYLSNVDGMQKGSIVGQPGSGSTITRRINYLKSMVNKMYIDYYMLGIREAFDNIKGLNKGKTNLLDFNG